MAPDPSNTNHAINIFPCEAAPGKLGFLHTTFERKFELAYIVKVVLFPSSFPPSFLGIYLFYYSILCPRHQYPAKILLPV
jgi:hypothetical protein